MVSAAAIRRNTHSLMRISSTTAFPRAGIPLYKEVAMDPKIGLVIAVVLIAVALLVIAMVVVRRRRKAQLQQQFGPEYERTVREVGPHRADDVLLAREKRVEKFRLRELTAEERERFANEWRVVQSRFVDDPEGAVTEADQLVNQLMLARGYPMSDFEQRAADISVSHATVVDHYRAAHQIAMQHQERQATTEDLRNAIIHYRALFTDLLEPAPVARGKAAA
jgi:hypothetical protein